MNVWTLKTVQDRCKEDGLCWIWQHSVNNKGAPQACINGKGGQLVRRWVYEQTGRVIRKGFVVAAKCGKPRCVSPDCAVQKSRSDVMRDQYADGSRSSHSHYVNRAMAFKRTFPDRTPLSFEKAREIRQRRNESATALSHEYGVTPDAIRSIWRNDVWKEPRVSSNASVFAWAQGEAA